MPHRLYDYIGRVAAAPGVRAWIVDALEECDFIAEDEPYRQHR
jgi:glutathione S-transferase